MVGLLLDEEIWKDIEENVCALTKYLTNWLNHSLTHTLTNQLIN